MLHVTWKNGGPHELKLKTFCQQDAINVRGGVCDLKSIYSSLR